MANNLAVETLRAEVAALRSEVAFLRSRLLPDIARQSGPRHAPMPDSFGAPRDFLGPQIRDVSACQSAMVTAADHFGLPTNPVLRDE